MAAPLLVGLGGGSCSGKTTLAGRIRDLLKPLEMEIFTSDRYYRPLDHLPLKERHRENFDSPEMLDRELLESHLLRLKAGEAVEIPVYDFHLHTRLTETRRLNPAPVIIVEGIFLLGDPGLRKLFDLAVYVEAGEEARLSRRILRDRRERGRTEEEVLSRYHRHVRPAHLQLVRPGRQAANLIVSGEGDPEAPARAAAGRIRKLLSAESAGDWVRNRL